MGLFLDAVGLPELVVWSANLHLSQIISPKPEHILFLKNESMGEITNESESLKSQNYDDFWFTFQTKEDGSFEMARFEWIILSDDIWEAIFKMRWELIKARRKERDQYRKKIQAIEQREDYKMQMNNQAKKQKEHREQIHYKDRTLVLYRRILEKLVLDPNDMK